MDKLRQKSGFKLKHKLIAHGEKPRKRAKKAVSGVNDLPWKVIKHTNVATLGDFDDGILEFEEVEGVDVVYEETDGGKVAKFNVVSSNDVVSENSSEEVLTESREEVDGNNGANKAALDERKIAEEDLDVVPDLTFDTESLLPEWLPYPIHAQILSSLHAQGFKTPTPIQSKSISAALSGKDVIGVAQTGSGKTLAYGLPILHYLMSTELVDVNKARKREVKALVLAPTRELALQVSSHLQACVRPPIDPDDEVYHYPNQKSVPPRVSVAAVVGGMSLQKQHRIIDRGVDILVATPGRLWDILGENDELAEQLRRLRFLVLDEADRMIETGHFAELDSIIRLTLRQPDEFLPEVLKTAEVTNASDVLESNNEAQEQMQTFVFSATLSKELQRNLRRSKSQGTKRGNKPASTLDDLLLRLDFRDPEPEIIDLSPVGGVVSTLRESQVECLSADKDVYLYYFLLRYPGRSLVFLSSVDGIRRLLPLLALLQLEAFPLHSQLQQKQRLKNLDRFKSTKDSILLATDVASRGLDIPAVDHVIHYQIPRSADVYIHRNGRTARAMRDGFSLLMCAPDERRLVRELFASLNRTSTGEIPEMVVELELLDKLKARIQLARKIELTQHRVTKEKHDKNWMKEAAAAMEIELDSDFVSGSEDGAASRKKTPVDAQTASLKSQLKSLLSQPLIARGIVKNYITAGGHDIVQDLLDGEHANGLLGFRKADSKTDLLLGEQLKNRKMKTKPRRPKNGNKK